MAKILRASVRIDSASFLQLIKLLNFFYLTKPCKEIINWLCCSRYATAAGWHGHEKRALARFLDHPKLFNSVCWRNKSCGKQVDELKEWLILDVTEDIQDAAKIRSVIRTQEVSEAFAMLDLSGLSEKQLRRMIFDEQIV